MSSYKNIWPSEVRDMFTQEQLAKRYGRNVRTLANWRSAKIGPKYVKVSGVVFYKKEDVYEYEKSAIVNTIPKRLRKGEAG